MISQHDIDRFNRKGYLVPELIIDPALIDAVIADITREWSQPLAALSHGTRLQDYWKESVAVKELATHPDILAILKSIFQRQPLPFQTLNFPVGTEQSLHADTIHFNSFPQGFMCGVWVALEDVDNHNGPLVYCPGSHKLPEYTMQDVGGGITYANYRNYEQFITRKVRELGLVRQRGVINRGQLIIWHGNLLHGGSMHHDKSRTRLSQVTHYYFEGCRYFTPMLSTPEEICFREPDWLIAPPAPTVPPPVPESWWGRLLYRHGIR